MTVQKLIEELKKYPPNMLVLRSCGGDCPGSDELSAPTEVKAWPSDGDRSYEGEWKTELHPKYNSNPLEDIPDNAIDALEF